MITPKTIRRRETFTLFSLIAGLFLAATSLEGQQVQGVVIDRLTGGRVVGASVMLVDTTFSVVAGTMANQTGAFRVEAQNPGSYFVLVEALGYRPTMDGILELGEGGSISVQMYLDPKPIELDSLKVAAERVQTYRILEDAGFNQRSLQPFGYFITPEEIRRRNPRYFFELFRNTPGVRVSAAGLMGTTIEFTVGSIRGPTCTPRVFVDGLQVNVEMGLEAVLEVDQIAGVEIYSRPSQVPLQWGGSDSTCGVLLFWTR